jgi:hypothetical protein
MFAPIRKTKWASYRFSTTEKKARATWREADKQYFAIVDALRTMNMPSREELHKRLDRRLDVIEKMRASAREQFPEVDESFTIAKGQM